MTVDMNGAINYAKRFVGKVPYSMDPPRDPEKGTADCSSFVYWSVVRGGGAKPWGQSYAPSTMSMPKWLYDNGFELISDNKDWNMEKGDIVIWGDPNNSYGNAGHTGICLDNQTWIEETGYADNVIISNHDDRLAMNGYPHWQVFRVKKSSEPKPVSKPQTPSDHDKAVAASKVVHQGNAYGKLERFKFVGNSKVNIAGWLVPDKPAGAIGKYAEILIMEHGTAKEITRVASQGIKRPDVKKNYGYKGGDALGMDVTLDLSWVKKGTKIDVIFRRCNQANGEGAVNDVRIKDIYLTL